MWELKDMSLSKTIPRFVAEVLDVRAMPSRESISLDNVFVLQAKPITSVLSEFKSRKFLLSAS